MSITLPPSNPGRDPLKPEWRAFIVTVNTCSSDVRLAKPLKQVWDYVVRNLAQFIVGRPHSHLLEVKEHSNVERGTKFHKIHLHSDLIFRTEGISFIDRVKLIAFVNKNLNQVPGFVRCHLNLRLRKSYNENKIIEEYIDKDPLAETTEKETFEVIPL
jgi:hypothetical protein